MKKISHIQYITQDSENLSHSEQAKLMFENGIDWVQIRMKNSSKAKILEESKKALDFAQQYNATLIINDSIDICKEIGAHGVHLGLNDLPINEAREILGDNCIIGGTANTFKDVKHQIKLGTNYIGLGPFRYTSTKKNLSPIIGLGGYKQIAEQLKNSKINHPIVAVGGILEDDIEKIKNTGLYGVAISTALLEKYNNSLNKVL